MRDFTQLQDDLLNALQPDAPNATGWRSCYCPVCNKTDRKTGGVYVDNNSIGYQCFRASCDANCGYEVGKPIPRKFKALCKTLNIKIPVSLSMVKNSFQKKLESLEDDDRYKKHTYKDMGIPKGWVSLEETNVSKWKDYYNERCVPLDDILYIKNGMYKGLTAIPMRFYDKVVGFQIADPDGYVKYRTITDNDHPVAINGGFLDYPTIVVEGILDQACFPNTMAIMRSKIAPEQAYALRGRDVIMLPDRSGNDFVKQAKEYGWKVCIPPWEENDLNGAVQRYGIMVVSRMISENIIESYNKADVAYKLWRM